MRYIGNKTKLLPHIRRFITYCAGEDFGVFCDLFSGTGSVGAAFSGQHKIIANDILRSSYVLSQAYINTQAPPAFSDLGFDAINHLNQLAGNYQGFFYSHYAPTKGGRMYFSDENAAKIDAVRMIIEEWCQAAQISEQEYYYLLACLLEAVSKVANVAGVYGAYLKHWDPRALKPLALQPLALGNHARYENEIYNEDSVELIGKISGDVLYLDPPYTKNDYAVQYHLLETLAKYDNPEIKGITGGRTDTAKSDFSSRLKAYVAFEKIIAEADFKYIVVSNNSNGLLEKEFIEKVLKKYAKPGSFTFQPVTYRAYTNSRSATANGLEEYLFCIEKAEATLVESPLNYMGSKFNILPEILQYAGRPHRRFVDTFGGGFNVGINAQADEVIFNDSNHYVKNLLELFYKENTFLLLGQIARGIKKYGLAHKNNPAFLALRTAYNRQALAERSLTDLYLLLQFGYQQQFRFNSKQEFNNTPGVSGWNNSTMLKLLQFCREIKRQNVVFHSLDFEELKVPFNKETLIYCDPPYLITLGSYNDGKRGFKGWSANDENRLYSWLDAIDDGGGHFLLSNVLEHKGQTNDILSAWLKASGHDYKTLQYKNRTEVLVKNY